MKILWFTWKDLRHPLAGGAEVVNEELAKRLMKDGHEVTLIVGGFKGGELKENHPDGYQIIRLGNRYTVYWHAYRYYKKHLQGWADLAIDEVNTIPFFTKFYVKEPVVLFVHMLCREIWFYQMIFPLNFIGYFLEPLYLRMIRGSKVITVSKSTKKDLVKNGFRQQDIHIISEGTTLRPVKDLKKIKKYPQPTILSVGAIRPMKQTLHILKAFELAKQKIPGLKLKTAGDSSGKYGRKFLRAVSKSPYVSDIEYDGFTTTVKKVKLMQKCHLLIVTSVKEGWGLTVTEAASQGTPTITYDADGLRDSVQNNKTGYVVSDKTPETLAVKIVSTLNSNGRIEKFAKNAWQWSKEITFEASYKEFCRVLGI